MYDAQTLRILSVNEAAIHKYGYSREEFLTMSMRDVRPPADLPPPGNGSTGDTVFPDGPPAARRHLTRTGEVIDVDVSSFTLSLEGRAVKLALVNDVTARRKAEDELRRSEGLFRGIFESTSAGVSLTDANGLFVSCNPAYAAMLGRSVEDVLRLTPASITHPDDLPSHLALMEEVRAGRRRLPSQTIYPPGGQTVWVEDILCDRQPAVRIRVGCRSA